MKRSYSEQGVPDRDDAELTQAIDTGVVPPGCLRGGLVVLGLHHSGVDPCAPCSEERERCGGRPGKPGAPPPGPETAPTPQFPTEDPLPEDDRRRLTIRELKRLVADEPPTEDDK